MFLAAVSDWICSVGLLYGEEVAELVVLSSFTFINIGLGIKASLNVVDDVGGKRISCLYCVRIFK